VRFLQGDAPVIQPPKVEKKGKKTEDRVMLERKDGRFIDYRWQEGRWVLSEFANPQTGKMDWPAWNSVRNTRSEPLS
jgi:hypothetical protein